MAVVEVLDFQIWAKHIHGDDTLKLQVLRLKPGELIELEVGGYVGFWKKMEDYRSTGEPTQGIKPLGRTARHLRNLCRERSEDLVPISQAHPHKSFVGPEGPNAAMSGSGALQAPAAPIAKSVR